MKYVKTFENFSINEEENMFKAVAGFLGKYNSDTREKAEKAIAEFGKKFRTSKHVDIFNQLKEAYDSKKETTLAAQKATTLSYEETKLTVEDVKKLFEEICCIIRMNDANAFGIKSNKEGKLETYQSKSYSGPDSPMGNLIGSK